MTLEELKSKVTFRTVYDHVTETFRVESSLRLVVSTNVTDLSTSMSLPQVALSIRQPWAWLILNAGKDIENRDWKTKFFGRFLIHASKGMTKKEYEGVRRFLSEDHRLNEALRALPPMEELERGGIIGEVEIIDLVDGSDSPWFMGKYGFVLRNPKPIPFIPYSGQLGFFKVTGVEEEIQDVRDKKELK